MGVWLPCIYKGCISEDGLKGLEGLCASDQARGDLPIVGIKLAGGGGASPHDGNETHCQGDGADSVVCENRDQGLGAGNAYKTHQYHPEVDAWLWVKLQGPV